MKKSHIILAAVPAICVLGGFGAGQMLKGSATAAPAYQSAGPLSPAEDVLNSMADAEARHPPASGGHDTPDTRSGQHSALQTGERIMPAAIQKPQTEAPAADVATTMHRVDPAILTDYKHQVALDKRRAEIKAKTEARMAELANIAPTKTIHPSLLPVDTEAEITEGAIKKIAETEDHVVKLGRMTVPVYKASSITYFVADFGVAVTNLDLASHYYDGQNAVRLRDQIMATLHTVAETQMMRGPEVDSDAVAERVTQDLRKSFGGIEDFIFLSLYKTDVPRG